MSSLSKVDPNALYRLRHIVRTKTNPVPIIDLSPSTWWAGVKSGRFPQPVRNGGMTFWRGSDLLALIANMGRG
jgi:hypothetical protein